MSGTDMYNSIGSNSCFDSRIEGCFRVVWWSFNIPGPRIGVVREG